MGYFNIYVYQHLVITSIMEITLSDGISSIIFCYIYILIIYHQIG